MPAAVQPVSENVQGVSGLMTQRPVGGFQKPPQEGSTLFLPWLVIYTLTPEAKVGESEKGS